MSTSNKGGNQSEQRQGEKSTSRSKQSGTSNRGFASMDPDRQREIASEGGKAAHEAGTAHEFTPEEARRAGSLSHGNRQSASSGSSSRSSSSRQGKQGDKDKGKS